MQQYQIPDTDETVNIIWMEDGLPAFFADRPNICELAESVGFSIYYLIGNNVTVKQVTTNGTTTPGTKYVTPTTVTKKESSSQIYKVVNNIVGRTISKANPAFAENEIMPIEEMASYNMPAIPWSMIEKLDQFFRLIDTQHGTEAIVLLTYDTSYEDSQGWGVLVPDQTNTAVHCNYDPGSVLEHKPENALIVGSVHSHPGMAAYASGTDHQDQADFDGLHITFGWQKTVNNGATQYHIEMQMSGSAYTLRPEDVFENFYIDKEPDPEVVEWSGKVKKVLPPHHTAGVTSHQPTPNQTHSQGFTQAGTRNTSKVDKFARFENFPEVWKNLGDKAIVIAVVETNSKGQMKCIGCSSSLSQFDIDDGYCYSCTIPIITEEKLQLDTLDDILCDLSYWCYQFNYSTTSQPYIWRKEKGKNVLEPLSQKSLIEEIKDNNGYVQKVSEYPVKTYDDEDEYYRWDEDFLVCCGRSPEKYLECYCVPKITQNDVLDFDSYTTKNNIYVRDSKCNSCQYFYDPYCPGYRNMLEHFVTDKSIPAEEYENKITSDGCDKYEEYNSRTSSNFISIYTDY